MTKAQVLEIMESGSPKALAEKGSFHEIPEYAHWSVNTPVEMRKAAWTLIDGEGSPGETLEVWFYHTKSYPRTLAEYEAQTDTPNWLPGKNGTPICIIDGKLKGWDQDFYDNLYKFIQAPLDPPQQDLIEKAIRKELINLGDYREGELTKADLEKVTSLNLNGTKITDEGLWEVAKLQNLTVLHLSSTQITDAGLKDLAKLQKLEELELSYCPKITDAGLKEVAKMNQLRHLWLNGTKVTDAGVAELRKALPKCTILHSYKKD